jgi:hypothetical protein
MAEINIYVLPSIFYQYLPILLTTNRQSKPTRKHLQFSFHKFLKKKSFN